MLERFRLAPFKRAVTSLALPERELIRRVVMEPLFWEWDASHAANQGYRGKSSHHAYDAERLRTELDYLAEVWYRRPQLDGVRWRHFQESVAALRSAGVQVVLLDPPTQPAFDAGIAHREMADADRLFHRRLAAYCRANAVPLLRYTARDLSPDDPDGIFVSLMHLNHRGASLLSHRVGRDLAEMLADGRLTLPRR